MDRPIEWVIEVTSRRLKSPNVKIDVAHIVYLRTLARGNQKYILRFEKYIL